ncbi:unnamed protein product [Acanthoscelides obtectus]|uniref:MADF domain-containing protein n=1 Tax=Acanthoscelides obtectus TaxID=200917 RepID=A0A9P0PF67_ACAOB|nr:unnamed protein product [Acanthoscelides obtectus]CAK1682117.1 hypothetical protein AOBTE_LOCUS33437 [Acanthoscelides obtectus]
MARWGDDKTLQFVILYRNHECLWNPKSSQYKNNILRNNAYEDMIMKMNDPTLSLKSLKTKIKNLRSVYHNELKKIEHSKRSGSGTAEVYNPSTSWFHEMHSFLGDTGDYRTSIELNVEDSSRSSSNPSKRRKKGVLEEGSITCALDRWENLTSVINRPTEYDEFHYFAQNVAAQLRALPLYAALDLQTEIQTLLIAARQCEIQKEKIMENALQSRVKSATTTSKVALSANKVESLTFMLKWMPLIDQNYYKAVPPEQSGKTKKKKINKNRN